MVAPELLEVRAVTRLRRAIDRRHESRALPPLPADAAGVTQIAFVIPTPDGRSYVYSYLRLLSYLYVVQGLK